MINKLFLHFIIFFLSMIFILMQGVFLVACGDGMAGLVENDDEITATTEPEEPAENPENSGKFPIWIDENENDVIDPGENTSGFISPFNTDLSSFDNANYYSGSMHPFAGVQPAPYTSIIFLCRGSDGLSLYFVHNADGGGGTEETNIQWKIITKKNDLNDYVISSDDDTELVESESHGQKKTYLGNWTYLNNSDGGVIGPFNEDKFSIRIEVIERGDIDDILFYSLTGNAISLGASAKFNIRYKQK